MPIYDYKCDKCGVEADVSCSWEEIKEPSKETLEKITCNEVTCPYSAVNDGHGLDWKEACLKPFYRVYSAFTIATDKLVNNKTKQADFKKSRQKRSAKHFEQDVMPSLSPHEQKHFKSKRGFKS